jgi:hypothetical protein
MSASEPSDTISLGRRFFPSCGDSSSSGTISTVKFTQENVKDKLVKYIHTDGEIGTAIMRDSVTFIVSDQNYLATTNLPIYDLNITISP